MTNKINGIDASECPLFDKKTGCYHTFDGKCVKDSCALYKWLLEYKRLQEENEKLKANKGRCAFKCLDNTFCDEAKIQIDKLKLDKDCLNVSLETARKYRGIAEADRDKYKQALQEIRKEITPVCAYCNNIDGFTTLDDCENVCEKGVIKYLKIIDETLNDRD